MRAGKHLRCRPPGHNHIAPLVEGSEDGGPDLLVVGAQIIAIGFPDRLGDRLQEPFSRRRGINSPGLLNRRLRPQPSDRFVVQGLGRQSGSPDATAAGHDAFRPSRPTSTDRRAIDRSWARQGTCQIEPLALSRWRPGRMSRYSKLAIGVCASPAETASSPATGRPVGNRSATARNLPGSSSS